MRLTRQEAINMLWEFEKQSFFDDWEDFIYNAMMEGCPGYNVYTDKELIQELVECELVPKNTHVEII